MRWLCSGRGLVCDEVRHEVRKLAVEGDVKLLPSLFALLHFLLLPLQLRVHASLLHVVARSHFLFHLSGSLRRLGVIKGDGGGGRGRSSVRAPALQH